MRRAARKYAAGLFCSFLGSSLQTLFLLMFAFIVVLLFQLVLCFFTSSISHDHISWVIVACRSPMLQTDAIALPVKQ